MKIWQVGSEREISRILAGKKSQQERSCHSCSRGKVRDKRIAAAVREELGYLPNTFDRRARRQKPERKFRPVVVSVPKPQSVPQVSAAMSLPACVSIPAADSLRARLFVCAR